MTFWHHQTKDWWTGLYCPGTKKHPQMPNEPAQKMPFEWIWGITTKYPWRTDRCNIRSFRSPHASSLSGGTTLGKKKKIYATTRRKSHEEEILIVLFFPRKKKKTLESGVFCDRNLPASWTLPALYYKRCNILIPEHTGAVVQAVRQPILDTIFCNFC